jgi:hypothetical protein
MAIIDQIIHSGDSVRYKFTDDATEWEKEAVREYGVTSKADVQDALDWREAIDAMSDQEAARVVRGKHPTEDIEIGRSNDAGRPNGQ